MKRVRLFGLFRELEGESPEEPSIRDSVSASPTEFDGRIVEYLRRGTLFVACPAVATDVLSDAEEPIGSPHLVTDGVWAWRADLAFYVDRYHLRLPLAFVAHMEANNWAPPPRVDVSALELGPPDSARGDEE